MIKYCTIYKHSKTQRVLGLLVGHSDVKSL